jgi:hypothetical protein
MIVILTAIVSAVLIDVFPGTASGGPPEPATGPAALRTVTYAATATTRGTGSVSVRLVPGAVYGQRQPTVRGTGTFDFAAEEGRIDLRESSGTEKILFVPQAAFVREPPPVSGASPLPAGKQWVSASLIEKTGAGSGLPLFVDQVEAVNAGAILDEIKWGATAAKPLGNDQVGAIGAKEYAVTLDLSRAQSSATGSAAVTFSRVVGYQVASLAQTSKNKVEVRAHVWVAGNGRIVQVVWSPPGSGVGTTSIRVFGPHKPIRVTLPPTSQTVDVATLSPGGEQESGLGDVA